MENKHGNALKKFANKQPKNGIFDKSFGLERVAHPSHSDIKIDINSLE